MKKQIAQKKRRVKDKHRASQFEIYPELVEDFGERVMSRRAKQNWERKAGRKRAQKI